MEAIFYMKIQVSKDVGDADSQSVTTDYCTSTGCSIPVDLNLQSTTVRILNLARFFILRHKKYHS
jgi:hypothetical protein